MRNNNPAYRWDIQGLRAIAVLAVVVFHINPKLLPGGYLGVDVFFVISGYLIIGFICRDLQQGNFSLVEFYQRRVKRLFPAFFVMALLTSCAAYFLLLPEETVDYAESLLSSLLYASNFYFYSQSGYFSSALAFSPLLHTWSLAVEEQFYLVFPLLLIITFSKKNNKTVLILFLLALLSLLLSETLVYTDKSLAFFASPSRFWQFIIGGLLAIHPRLVSISKSLTANRAELLTLTGLAAVVFCLFSYNKQTLFPGINALLPTIATALVIFSAQSSHYSYKLLSCAVAKFFGKISYSLYLWHWPIIIFYQLSIKSKPNYSEQMLILLCSVLLGFLSWFFIERSVKFINVTDKVTVKFPSIFNNKPISAIGLSLISSLLLVIIALYFLTGIPHRYTKQQLEYSAYINYDRKDYYRQGSCFLTTDFNDFKLFDKSLCVSFDSQKHNTLLIGDSHAAQWYSALAASKADDETITQVTSSGCKPTIAYKGAKRCTKLMRWAFEQLVKENEFDRIIIAARWLDSDLASLISTIDMLSAYTDDIKVFGNIIEYDISLPRLLASKQSLAEINQYRNYSLIKKRDQLFADKLSENEAQFISVFNAICPQENVCKQLTVDGNPIQYDYGHLTHEGAIELIAEIKGKCF